jgi:hypothetical protein
VLGSFLWRDPTPDVDVRFPRESCEAVRAPLERKRFFYLNPP